MLKGDNNIKLELEELIEGNSINKEIDDSIVMAEVEDSNENIWSFLLMSGYLKAVKHAFVLGMVVSLSNQYEVKSNKESRYRRYAHIKKCDSTTKNLMIIPKDTSKIGIIIEFKKIDYFLDDTIEEATKEALKQIEEKKYDQELLQKEIRNIIKLAIVFKGKEIKVTQG